jgi:hypothetical protein
MARRTLGDRVKQSVKAFASERNEALGQMNARLRKKIAQIEKLVSSSREATIRSHYEIGKEILDVRNNPGGVYDERPMLKLEKAFETSKRTLYKAASFAELYSPRAVDEVIAMTNGDVGFQLTYQHIVYLTALPTEELRTEFAKRSVANMWDPKELMRAIQRYKGKSKYAGPGRGHKLPAKVSAQIQQMLDMTRAWDTKYQMLWNGSGENDPNAFANIMAEPEENLYADDLDNLLALRDILPVMSQDSKEMKKLVEKAIKRVERILKSRGSKDMAAETLEPGSGREPRAIDLESGNSQTTEDSAPKRRKRRRAAATAGAT